MPLKKAVAKQMRSKQERAERSDPPYEYESEDSDFGSPRSAASASPAGAHGRRQRAEPTLPPTPGADAQPFPADIPDEELKKTLDQEREK